MEQTECSETSACKFQTPGNHPKESIQHSVHGESLKSRKPHIAKGLVDDVIKKYEKGDISRWKFD